MALGVSRAGICRCERRFGRIGARIGVSERPYPADLLHLDSTEGIPGWRYRHLWVDAEDIDGTALRIVTYIADGEDKDGNPSLRYITLLREGARAHGLPEPYLQFLDSVKIAE